MATESRAWRGSCRTIRYQVLHDGRFGTSFNLDGIWGGNMYAGGAGAILPNKITSKHNFRYVPKMNGLDIVKKLRAQLDANGYKDVEMKLIGDVPWSRGSSMDTDITHAHQAAAAMLGNRGGGRGGSRSEVAGGGDGTAPRAPDAPTEAAPTGGYWPSYLFADGEVGQKVGTVFTSDGDGRRRRWRRWPGPCRERILRRGSDGRAGWNGFGGEERRGYHLGVRAHHDGPTQTEDHRWRSIAGVQSCKRRGLSDQASSLFANLQIFRLSTPPRD